MIWARSSWFSIIRLNHLRGWRRAPWRFIFGPFLRARLAAAMAVFVSAAHQFGTEPSR